jgi:hypothetical protein
MSRIRIVYAFLLGVLVVGILRPIDRIVADALAQDDKVVVVEPVATCPPCPPCVQLTPAQLLEQHDQQEAVKKALDAIKAAEQITEPPVK